jgi:SpoVK/Ycf46/Vps4 family AAA+-type ATPase
MLSKTTLNPNLSIPHLAALTEGRSGSDLKELCREAAMRPLREEIRKKGFEAVKGGDEVRFFLVSLLLLGVSTDAL